MEERKSRENAGKNYERFHRMMARVIEKHPEELAVIREQVRQQTSGQTLSAASLSMQNPQSLVSAVDRYREVLISVLESDRCREALSTVNQTYQKLEGETGTGDPSTTLAPVIGILIGINYCIWSDVFDSPYGCW